MSRVRFQNIGLTVEFYREGSKFIAYSPALKLSTCGDSQSEAQKRFGELVDVFFEEIDRMGTCEEMLIECGWKKVGHNGTKRWQPPTLVGKGQKDVRIPCPA